jgi:thioredoxin 1
MASEKVLELTDGNWQKEVVESSVPVVVDFWAPWCGPCRALTPTINSLAAKYDGKVKVGKLNIDEAQETATKFGVTSIPRVLIFKGGDDPRQTFVGVRSEAELAKAIDGVLQEK